jgi:hypothetical protein
MPRFGRTSALAIGTMLKSYQIFTETPEIRF